ncbi:hypothetical protein B0H17DRAFT_1145821 [Mycena rosella]|uniref:Uncharacterized protein n=1 Tax=Mycena rosella TaxID=1033263 RepID=A0AAD7G428_MYCRO|nr:hypothetical protein B0H17DRAFT_1145821 [Mycena rosella]
MSGLSDSEQLAEHSVSPNVYVNRIKNSMLGLWILWLLLSPTLIAAIRRLVSEEVFVVATKYAATLSMQWATLLPKWWLSVPEGSTYFSNEILVSGAMSAPSVKYQQLTPMASPNSAVPGTGTQFSMVSEGNLEARERRELTSRSTLGAYNPWWIQWQSWTSSRNRGPQLRATQRIELKLIIGCERDV